MKEAFLYLFRFEPLVKRLAIEEEEEEEEVKPC